MSVYELIIRILMEIKPLLPGIIAVVVITIGMLIIISALGHGAWLNDKRFSLPGLFFGLDRGGVVCLACAWLKFLFPIVYIFSFQKLAIIQYLMIIMPGVILALCVRNLMRSLSTLFYMVLELAGIVCTSLICGYITDMNAGMWYWFMYVGIGIFMVLFGVYQFMAELEAISGSRSVDPKEIWRITEDGEL